MSVEAMAIALHHSQARGTAKVVLLGIANHAGDGGAFPKIATLAKYANVHPRRVVEALNTLGELGEIIIYRKDGGGRRTPEHQRPNLYELVLECPPECDRSMHHRVDGERLGRNYAGQQPEGHRVKDPARVERGRKARATYLAKLAAIEATTLPGAENSPSAENSTTPSAENSTTPSAENSTTKNHPYEPPTEITSVSTSPGETPAVENSADALPAQPRAAAEDDATITRFGLPVAQIERNRSGAAAARAALRGQHAATVAGSPAAGINEVAPLRHDQEGAA